MARILDDLTVRLNAEGTRWRLTETLKYGVGSKESEEVIEVHETFSTDFASVPAPARALISTWKKTARAAVVHDYLYSEESREKHQYSKRQADLVFLEVLGVVGHRFRLAAWAAVRAFGKPHWQQEGGGGVKESKVTPVTASQFAWVFLLGLLLVLVGAVLFYGFAVVVTSLEGSIFGLIAAAIQLIPALVGGLAGVIVGGMFLLAGTLEALSADETAD